jgi:transcriptional regulator with XRE-family HTH domain
MPRRTPKTLAERNERRRAFVRAVENGGMPAGEAVREARFALDFTQEAFGKKFGLTRRQVAEIENGAANPTTATLNRIARPFGMTVGFVHADPARRGNSGNSAEDV